jgi:TolB protein
MPPVAERRPPTPRRGTPAADRAAPPARRTSPLVWILGGIAVVLVLIIGALLILASSSGDGGTETPIPVTTTQAVARETSEPQDTAVTQAPPTAGQAASATATAGQAAPSHTPEADTPLPPPPTDTSEPPTNPPPTATDTAPPPTDTPTSATPTSAASFGRLAFSSDRDGDPEIFVVNLAGGSPQKLTNNNTDDWLPDWSPDGSRIAFTSYRSGSYDLWVMNADGSDQTAWVTTDAWDEYARWAPDGQRLSLSTTADTQGVPNSEIFVRQTYGDLSQVTQSTAENQWADWAPDGRLVYTQGFQDGSDWDIYISNADGSNAGTWLDGSTCDVQPTWSPDGQWIAFVRISQDTNGNGRIDFEDAGDVWLGRTSGNPGFRALTSGAWASTPAFSPDSQWIAYARVRDSNNNGISDSQDDVDILAIPVGGGDAVPLVNSPNRDGNPSWAW